MTVGPVPVEPDRQVGARRRLRHPLFRAAVQAPRLARHRRPWLWRRQGLRRVRPRVPGCRRRCYAGCWRAAPASVVCPSNGRWRGRKGGVPGVAVFVVGWCVLQNRRDFTATGRAPTRPITCHAIRNRTLHFTTPRRATGTDKAGGQDRRTMDRTGQDGASSRYVWLCARAGSNMWNSSYSYC